MVKFCRSLGIKVKDYVKEKKKQVSSLALVLGVAAYNATPSHAATGAINTGNTDVDEFVDGFIEMFGIAKLGFKALAIASIVLTVIVVLFFWIRGKAKQSVAGA